MSASPQQEEVRDKSQEEPEEEQQVEETEGELPSASSLSVGCS
jgi:hypothetical protein